MEGSKQQCLAIASLRQVSVVHISPDARRVRSTKVRSVVL